MYWVGYIFNHDWERGIGKQDKKQKEMRKKKVRY